VSLLGCKKNEEVSNSSAINILSFEIRYQRIAININYINYCKLYFCEFSVVAASALVFLLAILLLKTFRLPQPGNSRIGLHHDNEGGNVKEGSERNNIVPSPVRRSTRIDASDIPRKREFFSHVTK